MSTSPASSSRGQKPALTGRDLINIGIYLALYCILMTAVSMMGFIPIIMMLLSVIVPIVCGVPFMMFMTKVKKPGMLFIFNVIAGCYLWLTGMGFYAAILSVVTGLVAELVWRAGTYEKASYAIIAYAVFSIYIVGCYVPFFADPSYLTNMTSSMGSEYVESIKPMLHGWILPAEALACFVSGLIGGMFGRAVLKKHFEKAGIL